MEQYVYARMKWFNQHLFLLASVKGLIYVSTDDQDEHEFFTAVYDWFKISRELCVYNEQKLLPYIEQLKQYEQGSLIKTYNLAYDLRGTAFQQQVWQALLSLPYGVTTSYSAIAEQIGNSKAVRAVGRAIGANPILVLIPCHRVVGKSGTLTGFRAGLALKQQLLEHEKLVSLASK